MEPFNLAFHEHMLALGAKYERIPEFWEDVGDPENGPDLDGYAEHDLYKLDGVEYAMFDSGLVDRAPESPPGPPEYL